MIKILSVASVFLLFFTGITASISGFMLMYDPTGKPLRMSVALLESSPFDSYFFPGLILFLVIGISSIIIAFYVLSDHSYSTAMIFWQGIVLALWIIIQVIMIRQFYLLLFLYTMIAAALIYNGYYGLSAKSKKDNP